MARRINESSDRIIGSPSRIEGDSLLEFWRWAFGDLCDDDIKGIFAEWLVMKLLGIPSVRRVSWANSDLITHAGVRIEVKASALWQSWKLVGEDGHVLSEPSKPACLESKVRFGRLRARDSLNVAKASDRSECKSDLYVFAFQKEADPNRWNAMDLTQWEFYVCTREQLAEFGANTVFLTQLRAKLGPGLSADEFVVRTRLLIRERV